MTSRKKIHRARKQTMSLLTEAATALARRERALARKLVDRALEQGFMNARVHAESAVLLGEMGDRGAAHAAAWRARELAPNAPFVTEAFTALGLTPVEEPAAASEPIVSAPAAPLSERAARFAVDAVLGELRVEGAVVRAGWLGHDEVAHLREVAQEDPVWTAARALASERGTLEWAAIRAGAFPWVDEAVADAFACASRIANELALALGRAERFPLVSPPSTVHVERAVRLRFTEGAEWAARRDLGDHATFPLRGALALGPDALEIVLVDVRPGRRRERVIAVPPGAAAWLCARDRPVAIGGVLGLQPVTWSLRGTGRSAACVLATWLDVLALDRA